METKQFSVLGEYALKNTRFWSGFNQNLKFFGAWAGLDMATYPFMQKWIIDTAAADQTAEMEEHGDAFDPAKLAEDQAAQEEQEREIIAAGGTVNNAQLSTYNDVDSTHNTSSAGVFIVFPILAGRHSLGNLSFVSDQDKAAFDILARRIQLKRAMREQAKVRKIKEAEQLRTMFKEKFAADKTMYEEDFLAVGGPAAKARITALFNAYEAKVMAVLDASDSPDDQYEKIIQARQELEQALQKEYDEADRMQELLMEQQQQTISEEEYNPWEGFNVNVSGQNPQNITKREAEYQDWKAWHLESDLKYIQGQAERAQREFGPEAGEDIAALGNEYEGMLRAVFTGPDTWEEQEKRVQVLLREFMEKLDKKFKKYERFEQASRQLQSQSAE